MRLSAVAACLFLACGCRQVLAQDGFPVPDDWVPEMICAREFYFMVEDNLYGESWWEETGLSQEPMIRDAARLYLLRKADDVNSLFYSSDNDFGNIGTIETPFVMRLRGKKPLDSGKINRARYEAFLGEHGARFLGYAFYEWGGLLWRVGESDLWRYPEFVGAQSKEECCRALRSFYREKTEAESWYRNYQGRVLVNPMLASIAFLHHSAEWGADFLFLELGENCAQSSAGIGYARGAGRQYGMPWGVFIDAMWFGGKAKGYVHLNETCQPNYGHSLSLHRRLLYASYLAGANIVWDGAADGTWGCHYGILGTKDNVTPEQEMLREWYGFTRTCDRGVPYTPVAILMDFNNGRAIRFGKPHYPIWCGKVPEDKGDIMMDNYLRAMFPSPIGDYMWGKEGMRGNYLTNNPYGDIFDILVANPGGNGEAISEEMLNSYSVVILGDAVPMSPSLARRLTSFVEAGGTLLINAEHLGDLFPSDFLGIELLPETEELHGIEDVEFVPSGGRFSGYFTYSRVELHAASPLVVDPRNNPLVTENNYGRGRVILTLLPYLLSDNGKPVPWLPPLLGYLFRGLLPVDVDGDIEYMVNRNEAGWLVTLINNNGVEKGPRTDTVVDPSYLANVDIAFKGNAKEAKELIEGEELHLRRANGEAKLSIPVPSGDVRVIQFITE